jgi:hypothetical protein
MSLSTTHTCPLTFSVCWYIHRAIWTVDFKSQGSDASVSLASSSARAGQAEEEVVAVLRYMKNRVKETDESIR